MRWINDPKIRRWVVLGALLVVLALLLPFCVFGQDAQAATLEEPGNNTHFTVQLEPSATRSTGQCWQWKFGPYESHDGYNALRFGWGVNNVICTNSAATKWTAMPTYDPYHYGGYWDFDGQTKYRSQLGYSFITVRTTFSWSFKPLGFPLLHKDRMLACTFTAWNHTGDCTITY